MQHEETKKLIIDDQLYEVNLYRHVDKDGLLFYKCEMRGTSISTFSYGKPYTGATSEEALQKIAFEIRRALKELLES